MSCNCKNSTGEKINIDGSINNNEPLFHTIVKYLAKIVGFLIAVSLTPLIMLVIIWFMFDVIVLSKQIDLTKILDKFIIKARYFNEDDEDDDDDDYVDINTVSENDVVMLNAEDITDRKN
jgi:hypothetical protein